MTGPHEAFTILVISALLPPTVVTPARAFDGRGGSKPVVAAGKMADDGLYRGATEFVLDGTVTGDILGTGHLRTASGGHRPHRSDAPARAPKDKSAHGHSVRTLVAENDRAQSVQSIV